jgi:hypothetical protein
MKKEMKKSFNFERNSRGGPIKMGEMTASGFVNPSRSERNTRTIESERVVAGSDKLTASNEKIIFTDKTMMMMVDGDDTHADEQRS